MDQIKTQSMPAGIRLITWATAVSWIGWGFIEALFPVFIFSFSQTYAEAGIFRSIYHLVVLLTLPLVGLLSDRIASKTLIIIGTLLYLPVGLGYFLAGATTVAVILVATRVFHGIANTLQSVGRAAYFRHHADSQKVATAFGYFDTVSTFLWILAVASSILIVPFVKVHWLFLAIIPTYTIAWLMLLKLESDHEEKLKDGLRRVFTAGIYASAWKEVTQWNHGLRLMGLLNFFFGLIRPVIAFFIPIYALTQGANLQQVILITIALSLPALFGTPLGILADKSRSASVIMGLSLIALIFGSLAFVQSYVWQVLAAFLLGFILEFIELAGEGLTTGVTHPEHYGSVSGAMSWVENIGNLVGPVVIGFLIDRTGISQTMLIVALATLFVLLIVTFGRKQLRAFS